MTKANPLQESFNSGELSGKLAARLSFSKYPFAAEVMRNMLPLVEGGMMRRSGTRFVAELTDSTAKGRVLPFVFSTTQAYVVQAENALFRFLRNQGQILVPDTDAAITNGTFPSGITDWDDRSTGAGSIAHDAVNNRLSLIPGGSTAPDIGWAEQDVAVGATFDTNEHVLKFRVAALAGDEVELRIGTTTTGSEIVTDVLFQTGYHAYAFTPGDGNSTIYIQFRNLGSFRNKTVQIDDVSLIDNVPLSVDTPYATADLFQLKRAQTADVMYITHPSYPVHRLERSGHTSWSLVEVDYIDGPYFDENLTATTLLPSAASGEGINLTLSSTVGVNDNLGWLSTDIGRLVRYKKASAHGYAVITAITTTLIAVADVRVDFEATPDVQTTWSLGAWSSTTGYPATTSFFEQRSVYAATTIQPQTFWLSQSADIENMTPDDRATTVEDDDALNFTMAADEVNAIRWITGGSRLFIGTVGGEWLVKSTGAIIKPTDIDVKQQTTHGSADIQSVRIGHTVLFAQTAGRRVRELVFDFNIEGLRSPDLTILADHILKSGMVEMAFQESPTRVLWCVRDDGQLAAMTYERNENVVGWSRHIMGGVFGTGKSVVESVTTIPGNDGAGQVFSSEDRDEVWVIVKRTINGVTKRYVEFMEKDFEGPERDDFATDSAHETQLLLDQQDAFYVDSGLTYSGVATTTITGLSHLEGETVAVLSEGAIHPNKTVVSGSITLDDSSTKAQVGLPVDRSWKNLKDGAGSVQGTPVGQLKRYHSVTLVLKDAMGVKIGPNSAQLFDIPFREVADLMDTAVPLFTGENLVENFDGDWELDPRIVIEGDAPTPTTILGVAPRLFVNEL